LGDIVIVILAVISLILGWRLFRLNRGLASLQGALESDVLPERTTLSAAVGESRALASVCTAAYDSVTEAELQLALARGRRKILDYVVDQIEDAILIVDEGLAISYANKAALQLFGAGGEIAGRQLIEVCLDHNLTETVMLSMQTGGRMQERILLANSQRTMLVEAEQLDASLNHGAGAWVLLRDITVQLQTEQIRQDFVANASHELRTPLSIIRGHLEMLADDIDDPAIAVLTKHTDRISRLVDDMLMISRLEGHADGGGVADSLLNNETFDIGECVFGIVDQLRLLIDKHATEIELDLPASEHRMLYGDRFYFDQILFNLIENALKQNQKPGLKITIRFRADESSGRHFLDVIDNGVGIPAADLKAVFKRFYRVEKHHSQAIKGTGLGLSIVKRAVEAHRGTISLTSQPGRSTCFSISLPAPPVDTRAASPKDRS